MDEEVFSQDFPKILDSRIGSSYVSVSDSSITICTSSFSERDCCVSVFQFCIDESTFSIFISGDFFSAFIFSSNARVASPIFPSLRAFPAKSVAIFTSFHFTVIVSFPRFAKYSRTVFWRSTGKDSSYVRFVS